MQNDVNNEAEVSTTGETAVEETNQQEQPAEAQAPVAETQESTEQATAAVQPDAPRGTDRTTTSRKASGSDSPGSNSRTRSYGLGRRPGRREKR